MPETASRPEENLDGAFARLNRPACRRTFLKWSGISAAGLVIAGCGDDGEEGAGQPQGEVVTIDFGKGDIAVVNFAYALEQLEAAFYAKVNKSPPSDFTDADRSALEDIGAHEIAHREFFKAKLGKNAIPALTPDFSMVDFSSRESVLKTAQTFEDLGVSAYNGAAQFIKAGGPLKLMPLKVAGEIVSVEGRHASVIRELLGGEESGAFAPQAFDPARLPPEVLSAVDPFIKTRIKLVNLPRASS